MDHDLWLVADVYLIVRKIVKDALIRFWVRLESGYKLYHTDPRFSDRQDWANSVNSDQEQSDQGLHCLLFHLHLSQAILIEKATLSIFRIFLSIFWVSKFFVYYRSNLPIASEGRKGN